MRSGIPVPQHRNLHRPGLGETVLAVCPLRELPPSRLSGVVPGITQMVIRLTLEDVLDLHLGEQAASPVSCSPPARARSVSSRSSRSSAADRPPRPARGPLSRRSSVSPPSRNLHRSNFSPYLDGSGAGLSTGATGWSKLRLSATSISCSIPTGDPSITPMIPRPRFVTATRMSTGLAVAQKMVQTSGTALTGFSTLSLATAEPGAGSAGPGAAQRRQVGLVEYPLDRRCDVDMAADVSHKAHGTRGPGLHSRHHPGGLPLRPARLTRARRPGPAGAPIGVQQTRCGTSPPVCRVRRHIVDSARPNVIGGAGRCGNDLEYRFGIATIVACSAIVTERCWRLGKTGGG